MDPLEKDPMIDSCVTNVDSKRISDKKLLLPRWHCVKKYSWLETGRKTLSAVWPPTPSLPHRFSQKFPFPNQTRADSDDLTNLHVNNEAQPSRFANLLLQSRFFN